MRTITISVLNVVMPTPHNADRYVALFQSAFNLKRPITLQGDFSGMIGSCRVEDENGGKVVKGEFYKFFDLKLDGQWFNTVEQKPAEDTELAEIHIPENLKPHFQTFPFIFLPKNHRLFFITRDQRDNFSPGQAEKMLSVIFKDSSLIREYGEIDITVEPRTETLEKIFSMPLLKSLTIEVTPPNPDDHDNAERRLFERMGIIGATKQTTELTSKESTGLKPDGELKELAEIAKSNGKVTARGEDSDGKTVSVSTEEHPMLEKTGYNPKTQSRFGALISKAFELLPRITRQN